MNKKLDIQAGVLAVIIIIAALCRLLPHMQNFSPIAAIGLFGAAHFSKKWLAYFIPLLATFLSDILLNTMVYKDFPIFYEGFASTYLSYVLIILFGIGLFKKISIVRVILGSFGATFIFFLVTNIGCWVGNPIYSQNFSGILTSLTAGLPFIKGSLYSNLVFNIVLFGGYYILQNKYDLFRMKEKQYAS